MSTRFVKKGEILTKILLCQKLVGVGLVRIELTLLAEHRLSYTSSVMTLLDCQLHCLS